MPCGTYVLERNKKDTHGVDVSAQFFSSRETGKSALSMLWFEVFPMQ
jgi:hypothetical protein